MCVVCCVSALFVVCLWAVGCMLYAVVWPVFSSSPPCIVVVGIAHPFLVFDLIFCGCSLYCCFVYILHVFSPWCLPFAQNTPRDVLCVVFCCVLCPVCCVMCVCVLCEMVCVLCVVCCGLYDV